MTILSSHSDERLLIHKHPGVVGMKKVSFTDQKPGGQTEKRRHTFSLSFWSKRFRSAAGSVGESVPTLMEVFVSPSQTKFTRLSVGGAWPSDKLCPDWRE